MQHHDHHDQPADPGPDRDGPDSGSSASLSGANGQPLDEISRAAGDEVFEILRGVQTQIERLRGLHRTHEHKLTAFTRRSEEIEASEQEVSQRQLALQQQQAALAEHEGQLAESRELVEASQALLDEQRSELEQQQAQFSEQQAREAEERAEADRRKQDLAQREIALQQQKAELSPERFDALSDRCQSLRDQLTDAESRITEMSSEFDDRAAQIVAKDQQRSEMEERIQSLEQEVAQLPNPDQEAIERAGQLGREAALKVEDLTEQVRKLEAALREQSASRDQYREKFEAAQERIRSLADALSEQESQIGEAAEARAAVQQQQIAELASQLAQHKVASDPEQLRQKDQRIEDLVEALHQARGQSPGEQSQADFEARIHELTTANNQLKIEVERATIEAREALRQLEQQGHGRSPVDSGDLNNAQRPTANAQHLQRRRVRLARLRRALRSRTRPQPDAPNESTRTEQIVEMRDALAASERELIRKWARPTALVTLGWFALLAITIAGVSWFGADHFVPATVSASVTFQAKSRSGQPLSSAEAESWKVWHTKLLADTGFTNTLSKRLADRRLDRFVDPEVLRQRLQADLTIDAMQDGLMTVSLAGTDRPQITALLDTLATTLVSESSRRMSKQGGPHAVVTGGSSKGGRVTYATINPVPIHDVRLKYAGYIFGGLFPVCLFLIGVIYRRLARTKGAFDMQDGMFAVPAI